MKGFYMAHKAVLFVLGKILFPTKVFNKKAIIKKGPAVTVSNHLSWADVVQIGFNIPGFRRILAKKEVEANGFLKWWLRHMGVITVDRGKADMTAIRTSVKALKNGEILEIFPEGTRNKVNEELQEIKGGAAMLALKGDAYVQPIMIYRRAKFFRKNYIYVAEPFKLEGYDDVLDTEQLAKADAVIAEKMHEAHAELKRLVEEKKNKKKHKKDDKAESAD